MDHSLVNELKRRLRECYMEDILQNYTQDSDEDHHCQTTFDGYLCWNRSEAGKRVFQLCPDNIVGFDPSRLAHKDCLENGTWFSHPETGLEWSNYSNCVDVNDLDFRNVVNEIYFTGYSISLVMLSISLVIFLSQRSLHCMRIWIHLYLFASLLLSNLLWLIWYQSVIPFPATIQENPAWCIWLHFGINLTTVAAHMWMFCEAVHLYLVLVVVFLKEKVTMRCFLCIGCGLPVLLMIPYGSVRATSEPDNQHCWMNDSITMLFLTIPVCLSLLVSVGFLVCVVRVLLTKLHPSSTQPPQVILRKAARATVILVPLFGLHHLLIPFRPESGTPAEKVYQITSAILLSFQGVCVSCLFCFMNQEVHQALRICLRKFFPTAFFSREWVTSPDTMNVIHNPNSDINI